MENYLYSNHRIKIKESYSQKCRDLEEPMCNFDLETCQPLSLVDNRDFIKMQALLDKKYK